VGRASEYVTCFTAFVAVSMNVTESVAMETTARVRWSGENPMP
jgi:hypothetical protein